MAHDMTERPIFVGTDALDDQAVRAAAIELSAGHPKTPFDQMTFDRLVQDMVTAAAAKPEPTGERLGDSPLYAMPASLQKLGEIVALYGEDTAAQVAEAAIEAMKNMRQEG